MLRTYSCLHCPQSFSDRVLYLSKLPFQLGTVSLIGHLASTKRNVVLEPVLFALLGSREFPKSQEGMEG
jgi:hypothetical protein